MLHRQLRQQQKQKAWASAHRVSKAPEARLSRQQHPSWAPPSVQQPGWAPSSAQTQQQPVWSTFAQVDHHQQQQRQQQKQPWNLPQPFTSFKAPEPTISTFQQKQPDQTAFHQQQPWVQPSFQNFNRPLVPQTQAPAWTTALNTFQLGDSRWPPQQKPHTQPPYFQANLNSQPAWQPTPPAPHRQHSSASAFPQPHSPGQSFYTLRPTPRDEPLSYRVPRRQADQRSLSQPGTPSRCTMVVPRRAVGRRRKGVVRGAVDLAVAAVAVAVGPPLLTGLAVYGNLKSISWKM